MEPNLSPKLKRRPSPGTGTTQVGANVRIGMQAADLRQAVIDHLHDSVGPLVAFAKPHDYYRALSLAYASAWSIGGSTPARPISISSGRSPTIWSTEFLIGPYLGNNRNEP